ncbi:MAG: undecaprenyl-diphosphate phosphatase [Clostridia bacterium]|nr:undecaprenyl-diphosphate phosphatase [Clostridia bacterium]
MKIYQAIILGIVQGFTEFFPISSSGHLAVTALILGTSDSLVFSILMHIATLIPILTLFKKEFLECFKNLKKAWLFIIATIPAGITGLLFSSAVSNAFSNINFLAVTFFISAIIVFLSNKVSGGNKLPTRKSAFFTGAFQAFAIFPGVSRSGTVLLGLKLLKIDEDNAKSFAFIMSVPIILASLFLSVIDGGFSTIEFLPAIFGFISATVSGFIALIVMKTLPLKKLNRYFFVYLLVLSATLFICA